MIDGIQAPWTAKLRFMASKEPSGKNSPLALRLRALREALGYGGHGGAGRFAALLDLSAQRWNNYENGLPLSREVAIKLVRTVPGLTLDWLYLGRQEGMAWDLVQRLDAARPGKAMTFGRS